MDLIKRWIFQTRKNEIKYGFESFEVRSNFTYRNFLRFETEIELKIRKDSRV
jgi:hypothetical protein